MKIGRLALGVHSNLRLSLHPGVGRFRRAEAGILGVEQKRGPDWAPSFFDRAAPNPGLPADGPLG